MDYKTEVFDSDGSLAIQRDGVDVAHLSFPYFDGSVDPGEAVRVSGLDFVESRGAALYQASDEAKQQLIDAVVLVLKLGLTADDVALISEALDSHEYWQLSDPSYRDSGFVRDPGSDDPENQAEISSVRELARRVNAVIHEQSIRSR